MARWLKISLKIISAIFIVIALLWCGLAYYLHQNNKSVLQAILQQLNAGLTGKMHVGAMEPTLLKGFPGVSVSLKEVSLKDTLWEHHRHDLLRAGDIDVSLNVLSLLTGQINIRKIAINHAHVYIYTDSSGYSNTSIFKPKPAGQTTTKKEQPDFEVGKIDFNGVSLVVDNQKRSKRFHFDAVTLKGRVKYPDSGWTGSFNLKTNIKSFAFNTKKGSFLKDKSLQGTLIAHYDKQRQEIILNPEKLKIGGDDFYIGAQINLAKNDPAFSIQIRADAVSYERLSTLLAPNISSKLLKFAIAKPIQVTGTIADDGKKDHSDPLINVRMIVKDNTVTFPSGELTRCSFTGTFTNKNKVNEGIGDENSLIRFYNLTGDFYNAPLRVDTFSITNLSRPVAEGFVTSAFNLSKLNRNVGEDIFLFKDGQADLRLFCRMDIDSFRFTKPVLSGNVVIKNADITYLPRNMRFVKSNLTLFFNQKDLSMTNSRFQLGKTILYVDCHIQNFLNFYYTDPAKIVADLKLRSPVLSLSEFMTFLGPRKTVKKKIRPGSSPAALADQLATVLELSRVNIALNVDKTTYKRFVANRLTAAVAMTNEGIYFNNIHISHAGGSLKLSGNVKPSGKVNTFLINSSIDRVNVKEFFHAFENFGQTTITSSNLKGLISARVNASGRITDQGNVVSRSMYGQVNFKLQQAALIGFEPLQKVQKLVFRNRDFNYINLDDLDGMLILNGDRVNISPMKVNTSVLNFNVKGIYGFNEGTDIAMDIPLRNPKKNEGITDKEELELARMKGIVLHLKAVDDGKGGVKIRWNSNHD